MASLHDRGSAVFIVNKEFKTLRSRDGAKEDLDFNMQAVFAQTLGFEWINQADAMHFNVSLDKWNHKYNEDSKDYCGKCVRCLIDKRLYNNNSKYFLLAISTHGQQDKDDDDLIKFSDGQAIKTQAVLDDLDDDKCEVLKGKTRIVLISACRTNLKLRPENREDRGIKMFDIPPKEGKDTYTAFGNDVPQTHDRAESIQEIIPSVQDTLKIPPDFLVVYSTTSGKKSKSSVRDGGWMFLCVKEVVEQQMKKTGPWNLLKILTEANKLMSLKETTVFKRDTQGNILQDKDGKDVVDEDKSGMKSNMCIYHNLTDIPQFYPKITESPPKDKPSLW